VSTSGVYDEQAFGVANDPNAILLLEFGVDPKAEIGGVTDFELCGRFKDGSRKKETQKHEKVRQEGGADGGPDDATTHLVDRIGWRAFDSLTLRSCRTADWLSGGFRFVWGC